MIAFPLIRSMMLVSILVLMDMALEAEQREHKGNAFNSFNPCFDGYGSGSGLEFLQVAWHSRVSILVLMDMALEVGRFRFGFYLCG